MFPLETVRTRLAVDHRRYMNVPNALRTIAAEEGVLALYRVRLFRSLLGCRCLGQAVGRSTDQALLVLCVAGGRRASACRLLLLALHVGA